MTRKYETRCWLCSSRDLEPDDRGVRCNSCGATFNLLPKPGSDCITLRENVAAGLPDASPSGHLLDHIARVRKDTTH